MHVASAPRNWPNLDSATASGTLNLADFTVPTSGTVPTDLQTAATLTAVTSANKSAYPIQIGARSWFIARAARPTSRCIVGGRIKGRNVCRAPAGHSVRVRRPFPRVARRELEQQLVTQRTAIRPGMSGCTATGSRRSNGEASSDGLPRRIVRQDERCEAQDARRKTKDVRCKAGQDAGGQEREGKSQKQVESMGLSSRRHA